MVKKLASVIVVILISAVCTSSTHAAGVKVYAKDGWMFWNETLNGNSYDQESGQIYTLGAKFSFHPKKNFFGEIKAEGFGGLLRYKGVYISNDAPCDMDTLRIGTTLEGTAGYKIKIPNKFYVSPFVSAGVSAWKRSISGEIWLTGYGKVGFKAGKGPFFIKTGLFFPVYAENWIILMQNDGQLTKFSTRPNGVITPFAEIGFHSGKIKFSLSYELKKWKKSNDIGLGNGLFGYQPDTSDKEIYLQFEYSF